MDAIDKYLEFLWNCFQYDIEVFSQAWLYYWALVPAVGYLVFFVLKWAVLTVPVWLPVSIILRIFHLPGSNCDNCLYKTQHEFKDFLEPKQEQEKGKESIRDAHTLLN
jgi:hypothetical protein